MQDPISRALKRWSVRRHQFDGTVQTLDALYDQPDPWKLGSRELPRFEATNALIAQYCPRPASILEIGCGEGYQTRYLSGIADHITGVDISGTALARARLAVPRATFLEGTLPTLLPMLPQPRYDLVTLCEVLIYGNNPAELIAAAQSCADAVLVTNFEPQSHGLAPLVTGAQWRDLPPINLGRKRWKTYLWMAAATG